MRSAIDMLRDFAATPVTFTTEGRRLVVEAMEFIALYDDEGEVVATPTSGFVVKTYQFGGKLEYRRFEHPVSALAYAMRKAPAGQWNFVENTDDATGDVVSVTFTTLHSLPHASPPVNAILVTLPPDIMKAARMVLGV